MTKIMHLPAPGPDYWNWRCLICGEPVRNHANAFALLWNNITKPRKAP